MILVSRLATFALLFLLVSLGSIQLTTLGHPAARAASADPFNPAASSVSTSPDSGLPGYTSVGVSGSGYTADASITIGFEGSPVGTCSADGSGDLLDCSFVVPSDYPGVYEVSVTDGTNTAYSPFTVESGCTGEIGEVAGEPQFVMPLGVSQTYNWIIVNNAPCAEVVFISQLPAPSGTDPPTLTASPMIFTVNPGSEYTLQSASACRTT